MRSNKNLRKHQKNRSTRRRRKSTIHKKRKKQRNQRNKRNQRTKRRNQRTKRKGTSQKKLTPTTLGIIVENREGESSELSAIQKYRMLREEHEEELRRNQERLKKKIDRGGWEVKKTYQKELKKQQGLRENQEKELRKGVKK